ncbi:hypothetical protein Xbed_03736 [Xenorhabdus beddingii]|uniref:Uncharacterized protein n=1 Tax=Xenorhabdus beddingii TaxID=40578 RepID=A0A1Y2S654_9GAMM|nr:hypothetical protein Xbed_03736 [Xenorhabdus beddingii]
MGQTGEISGRVTGGGFGQMLEGDVGEEKAVNALLPDQAEKLLRLPPQDFLNQDQTAAFSQSGEDLLKGNIEPQRGKLQGLAGSGRL